MDEALARTLADVARDAAHRALAGRPCAACGNRAGADDGSEVLADRSDASVVRHGTAVAKAHAPGTEPDGHRARLAVAAHPLLRDVLVPPLSAGRTAPGDRLVTAWPYGEPVDPRRPEAAPWEQTAVLLAELHRLPVRGLPGPLPAMRGPARAAEAIARMRAVGGHPYAADVERVWWGLPAWARGEEPSPGPVALCHGDLHLGQLVRRPGDGHWLLVDVDDVGLGDPAWDLARPAAWFAAGLLAPDVWHRFLDTYRAAGGPAVPPTGDPWPRLDVPARALTAQAVALAVAKSVADGRAHDPAQLAMTRACARIADLTERRQGENARRLATPVPPAASI